jgi:fructose-1,6-bisphosphatase/inositol monophosphatase family enzyme
VNDYDLAADLVRSAGTLAADMLAGGLETRYKTSISDVVSGADEAAERLVADRLGEVRPDDAVVGEEGAKRPGGRRTWYIDPVDGTYNFLSRVPYWCSAIGLVDEAGPVAGAVYYPGSDELWVGGPAQPTTLDGEPVPELLDQPLAAVSIATYLHPRYVKDHQRVDPWLAAVSAAATLRMLGSASVDLAGVASGRLGVFLQANLSPWDWYPGAALVIGAGGVAETLPVGGNVWQIAGNRQSVAETKAALQG